MNLRLYTVLFALLPGIAMGAVRGDASRVGVSRAPAAGARAPAVTKKASTNKKTTNASKVAPAKTVPVAESVAEEEYIEPEVEEIAEERPDIKVGKINVDEEGELAQAYGVMSIPTLIVLKDGKVANQATGARPKAGILALL